ncbi:MAG: response regulator [Lachnospiraceae bacterium]|nr:response regulator [Lachnospiraceae bacterium]
MVNKKVVTAVLTVMFALSLISYNANTSFAAGEKTTIGGGYAVTGQIEGVGYASELYDATNGLPTSDANYILGASNGYIYIGGYSGIMRYDGTEFKKLTLDGLTSGRGLFEDKLGRIWVGTNDNGVVVIDGNESKHFTYKDGLPSSSVRIFAEDNNGNVYIGTTAGVCYVDLNMSLTVIDDERINEERVLKLESDVNGIIYGQTKNGNVFSIKDKKVSAFYSSSDLGMETITTILVDKDKAGIVYLCTEGEDVYYGLFGKKASDLEKILVAPISNVHWATYACDRVWFASTTVVGYLDEDKNFVEVKNLPMDSAIEMMTADYQGNMWFASSTQGVMKIVTNNFVNITQKSGLPEEVVNATCLYDGLLYIGTDNGVRVVDDNNYTLENKLTKFIGDSRIRSFYSDSHGNIWVATFTNNVGLVRYNKNGTITQFTVDDGMPSNEVRCLIELKDGTICAGTNGGVVFIKDNKIVRTVGSEEGLKNTVILTVAEKTTGEILAGSDGDGIYVIKDNGIERLGRDEGLTSDVIMRIKRDDKRDMYWIVTSNSIQYIQNDLIKEVTTFPNNNNYDLYFDNSDNMWILSSYGIYTLKADDMYYDKVSDYRLYAIANGLTSTPTSNSYSALSDDGDLYVSGRSGVCKVNIDHFFSGKMKVKVDISSVYCGDTEILANKAGIYEIPSSDGRIKISAAVLDYTLVNPTVRVYIEGKEKEGINLRRSQLTPLEYTGLKYGNYKLHIQVFENDEKTEMLNEVFVFNKQPRMYELIAFKIMIFILVAAIAGIVVWRVMKTTVIRKQYAEIKQARDEAERANTAKTRFLANMSHEIRTPINTIMGMDEMILREDATDVPKGYFMSMINYALDIQNASETLLGLINDLLDMSKIESGKMHLVEQEYDVVELLRSIVTMIRVRSTEKELIFDVNVDEIIPRRMYGDAGKIKQIVLNLLTNAVKYTEKGGFSLNLSLLERQDDDLLISFSVKDTGIGVKEEDMDKLFTAYERLDEEKNSGIQGTGLGLDISRRFAELMGGSLVCESVYGKGSEFILTINQKIVDATPIGVFKEHDEGLTKGPYVPLFVAPDADVLVVDDTPMNLTVIKGLLKATKIFVTTASSGEECLEKIKETKFNIVLLDHMMPGMDGLETVAEIRKEFPDLPVYALTANATVGEEFYKSKGFDGYLSKPIDSEALERTILKHLPEEMVQKPEATAQVSELTEIPEDKLWIYETDGIDVDEGIKNSGGISQFLFSLGMFRETIDGNVKVIQDAYDNEDIRLYTIKVHALKSSARFVGAMHLSKLAEALEDAGNKENTEFIKANNDDLINEYTAYKEKLERIIDTDDEEEDDREEIPKDELDDAYNAFRDLIPQMDYDSVEMVLDQLKEYRLPKDDAEFMAELEKKLKTFDWDGMEEMINNVQRS